MLTELDEMIRQVQAAPPSARTQDQMRQLMERRQRVQDALSGGSMLSLESTVPPWVSLALGSAYFRAEQFADAEREYKAAIAADSKSGEAYSNLAVVYLQTGRYDEAEKAVKAAEKAGFRVNPMLKEDITAKKKAGLRPSNAWNRDRRPAEDGRQTGDRHATGVSIPTPVSAASRSAAENGLRSTGTCSSESSMATDGLGRR